MKILFASNNEGKIKEAREIWSTVDFDQVTPNEVFEGNFQVEETGATFEENALLKAKQMGEKSGLLTIADDSGLVVDALGGAPGVYSARYADTPEAANQKVLQNLKDVDDDHRTARFVSAMCVYNPRTKKHHTVRGEVEGIISKQADGEGGFGYDPIFYSMELEKTFGNASSEEKNRISHRKRAMQKILPIISEIIETKS